MSIEEGAKFVAAAYAVILAVLVLYYFISARRVNTLQARRRAARTGSPAAPARAGEAGGE